MFPGSYPSETTAWTHRRRRGRPGLRPELEAVEDRCLLSGYNVSALTYTGGYLITAAAINNLGQVAGRGSYPANNAVVWQNGTITNLDPQQRHGALSYALDLTDPAPGHEADVQVVGATARSATTNGDVFLWAGGTMYDTSIPYSNPGFGGPALAISNSGVVAGGYQPGVDSTQSHAYIWSDGKSDGVKDHVLDPGELQDLNGVFPNAASSVAEDVIDASGPGDHLKVVANAYVPTQGGGMQWRAYLLTDRNDNGFASGVGIQDLGTLRGGGTTLGIAINDMGQIAGGSGSDAFRWQNGVMTDLGQLSHYGAGSNAINHGGQVVGAASGPLGPATRAWIWTGSGKIQDLNGLIPKNSGWTLEQAYGISDSGRIIGAGLKPSLSNDQVAFLLTPTSAPSPANGASTAGISGTRSPGPVPGEVVNRSAFPIPVPLTPMTDGDLTLLASELIRSGKKGPRPFFHA